MPLFLAQSISNPKATQRLLANWSERTFFVPPPFALPI
jgi:hypothetical protein